MDRVRIIEVKQSVFADNDRRADQLRRELKERGIFLLNLMSSPGSGKTTTLARTVELLKDEYKIGVLEADIDSDVDARTMAATGVEAIQLHTGGMCHLDADMTRQGLDALVAGDVELAILENVGNLVCPTWCSSIRWTWRPTSISTWTDAGSISVCATRTPRSSPSAPRPGKA